MGSGAPGTGMASGGSWIGTGASGGGISAGGDMGGGGGLSDMPSPTQGRRPGSAGAHARHARKTGIFTRLYRAVLLSP